jgi:CheY-like chemotaxis protein
MVTDRVIPQELKDKIKILVVEDNILNQKLAGFMIKKWGFQYDICENGKLAIENPNLNKYDLILMDIQMPEMNGYETTQYIREHLKLGVPIIAMTSHVMPGEREKCLSFGMTDYISKPIREEEFYNLITNYLFVTVVENAENKWKMKNNNNSEQVVNLDYLLDLSKGNAEFVKEMISIFLEENPEEIETLDKGIREKNFDLVKSSAHKLRSTIPFVGLDKIIENDVCEIESLASEKSNFQKIEKIFPKIKEACEKARQQLTPSVEQNAV